MARKDQLSKLGMPKMPMAEKEVEMDLEMGEMPEEMEAGELEEGEAEEMAEEGLSVFSDDELLEELKLRGLSLDAESEMDNEDEDLDLEELPEDEEDEL